jgi:hypothetical protein
MRAESHGNLVRPGTVPVVLLGGPIKRPGLQSHADALGRAGGADQMKIETRLCDVCCKDVNVWMPLNISARRETSPTGEPLDIDLCSIECLVALPLIAAALTK